MEREILFRGKRVDNGEWVEGFYNLFEIGSDSIPIIIPFQKLVKARISDVFMYQIDLSTRGQYTGLTDKNGRKIFEGDIVTGTAYSYERIGVIVWIEEIAGFGVKYRKRRDAAAWENASILRHINRGRNDQFTAEVIGNIHDNPELMGGGTNV